MAGLDWLSSPTETPLHGRIRVPGDKSISHRAIMLAALAEGCSHISGFLEGEDTRATATIFEQLGVRIEKLAAGERWVHGVGLHGLCAPEDVLDCGNAGTAMRLLTGLLAGQVFDSVLTGDASLLKRPMRRVLEPLRQMSAGFDAREGDLPPLHIHRRSNLNGCRVTPEIASAQVKSAILLAGLYAQGNTEVHELHPTRDYTERMLAAFGWPIEFSPGYARLSGGHVLRATDIVVPADFSSAAFLLVAGSVIPGSNLHLLDVGLNPRRTGLLQALRAMGADIREGPIREQGGERVADLQVRHAPLQGVDIPEAWVADMIDEFPALFVAAALAQGSTRIRGAGELRMKESDRLAVMAAGLRKLGVDIEERPDGARIEGGPIHGGEVDSHADHRCAMAFAVAGQVADDAVLIRDCSNVNTSFPGFVPLMRQAGFNLSLAGAVPG